MSKVYRQNVIAIFQKGEKILACQRSDTGSWQLPQGGIDPGENPQKALFREMEEELGDPKIQILQSLPETISYDFPQDMKTSIARKYKGQEQYWFLCKLQSEDKPDLTKATSPEFVDTKFMSPHKLLDLIIHWKYDAYRQAFQSFKLI